MRRHLATLAALILLTATVQVWCVQHAVVPAQDAVRYVNLAQAMQQHGFLAVMRATHQEPLFPALVCQIHTASQWLGFDGGISWLTAVQLAAASASTLTIIPLYGLMLSFVPWRAAIAGGVFYATLGSLARLGADGLADSTHLLLLAMALLFATIAWKQLDRLMGGEAADSDAPALPLGVRRPIACIVAASFATGLVAAIATLAKAEALLLVPAWFLVLLCPAAWRLGRRQASALAAVTLLAGFGIVMIPYMQAVQAPSLAAAAARLMAQPEGANGLNHLVTPEHAPLPPGQLRTEEGERLSFERKDPETSLRRFGWLAASREFLKELPGAFQYAIGALAVVGLGVLPATGRHRLADRFIWAYWILYTIAVLVAASQLGYLSTRHVLPLVLLGMGPAGLGAMAVGERLTRALSNHPEPHHKDLPTYAPCSRGTKAAWGVVAAVAATCLVRTLPPLHAGREPHRKAAEWIAQQHAPGRVLDTRGWTGLITGRETYTYERAPLAWGDPHLAYVVLEHHELNHDTARSRTLARLLEVAGEPAATFANPSGDSRKDVAVYRWFPERLSLASYGAPHQR